MKKDVMEFGNRFKDLDPVKSIKEKITAFIIDEIIIQITYKHFWLWVFLESTFPKEKYACCRKIP